MKVTVVSKEFWDDRSMGVLGLRVETDRIDLTFNMYLSDDGGCEWVETSVNGQRVTNPKIELLEEWVSDAAFDGDPERALGQKNSVMPEPSLHRAQFEQSWLLCSQ